MKNLKHRIKVNVSGNPGNETQTILKGGDCKVRNRRLSRFLGGNIGILVLVPEGGSISSVEVHSEAKGGVA